jgi:NodT family efflux transporter outer membrane factor (OMF) lipoprotein
MNRSLGRGCALPLAFLLLTSCAVGPDYRRPAPVGGGESEREMPAAYKEAPPAAAAAMEPARPADDQPRGEWWKLFGDPQLDALVALVDLRNQTLAASEARYRQAQAALAQSRAAFWPTINATMSRTRAQGSAGSVSVPGGGTVPVTSGTISSTLNAAMSTSWEIDLWGRIRRNAEASEANLEASAGDLEAARLSLRAQVATAYVALRVVEAQRALLDETAAAFENLVRITESRRAAGVATTADVLQARTQLLSTRAQAVDTGTLRAQLEHALATLTGRPPSELTIAPAREFPLTLPSVAPQLPARLLERRPDIAAAERRVAAANAQIGVATAAFYPALTLNASGGYRGPSIEDLFTLPHRFWSFAPALAMPLFDAGARSAVRDQTVANHEAVVAAYRQTVLSALQDVEDQLALVRVLGEEHEIQGEAERAASQAAAITSEQYRAGTVGLLNLQIVRAAELNARRTLLAVQGQRLTATVGLIRAMGGQW